MLNKFLIINLVQIVIKWLFCDKITSWVEQSLHAKFQLSRLPRSGRSMVGHKRKQDKTTKLGRNRGIPKTQLGLSLDQQQQKTR